LAAAAAGAASSAPSSPLPAEPSSTSAGPLEARSRAVSSSAAFLVALRALSFACGGKPVAKVGTWRFSIRVLA
jgi:hypothetical protein